MNPILNTIQISFFILGQTILKQRGDNKRICISWTKVRSEAPGYTTYPERKHPRVQLNQELQ